MSIWPQVCLISVQTFPVGEMLQWRAGRGFVFIRGDIEGIRSTVLYLLNNPDLAQKIGIKGREYIMSNCNWGNEEQSLLSL